MNFTKDTLWKECEELRTLHDIPAATLSTGLFPKAPQTLYATRRNLKDGGMFIVFTVLQYFGLSKINFNKTNAPTGTKVEAEVIIADKSIPEITMQLATAVKLMAYNTLFTKLPQTLRRVITTGQVTNAISLLTFEKAFDAISGVTMTLEYSFKHNRNQEAEQPEQTEDDAFEGMF